MNAGTPVSPHRARTDTKPWYRQFWPWFLIALPLTSVVASFVTLWIAVTDADEVLPHEGDSTSYSAPSGPASPEAPQGRPVPEAP